MQKTQGDQKQQKAIHRRTSDLAELQGVLSDAVTIGKTPKKVFEFVRNLENFPLFMKGLIEVKKTGPHTYHWIFGEKKNKLIEWDVRIVKEIPGSLFQWESLSGAPVTQRGVFVISQAPGGRGTVVQMALDDSLTKSEYREIFEDLTSDEPDVSTHTNLRRLKSYLETGEVPTTEGQPTGRESLPEVH